MKTKRLFYFLPLFLTLLLGNVSCSSKDDEEKEIDPEDVVHCLDESTGPFTAIVKYVTPELGSVQVVITEIPESNNEYIPRVGAVAVIPSSKEMLKADLQVDDVIKFKILEFKLMKGSKISEWPRYVVIKAKPYPE